MSALLPEAAGFAVAPPADLLHGLALRPPLAGWDGTRYRGSVLDSVRLDEGRAQAGVVAVVRREHFVGVVAVTPLHARQALASMEPAWRGDGRPAHEDPAQPSARPRRKNVNISGSRRRPAATSGWPPGAWTAA